jgi:hypothetical protein
VETLEKRVAGIDRARLKDLIVEEFVASLESTVSALAD